MTMKREEQIKEAARQRTDQYSHPVDWSRIYYGFIDGAKWADQHPQWYDAQGDIVPEYGREVIVIGRNGKVFYGHRPDPKEYIVVEGEKLFAKTYDKNGWNWPNIALWLDVEVPDKLIDEITTKWFKENGQRRDIINA